MDYLDYSNPLVQEIQEILATIEKKEKLGQMKRNIPFINKTDPDILNVDKTINPETYKEILENKRLKTGVSEFESKENLLEREIPLVLVRVISLTLDSIQGRSYNMLLKRISEIAFDVTGRLKIGLNCTNCLTFLNQLYLTQNTFSKFDSVIIMDYNQEMRLVKISIEDSSLPFNQLIFSFFFNSDFSCNLYEIDKFSWCKTEFMERGYCCVCNKLIRNYLTNNILIENESIRIKCTKKDGYFFWVFSHEIYWIEAKLNIWDLILWIKLQK